MNKPIQSLQHARVAAEPAPTPSLERRRLRAYLMVLLADSGAILAGFAMAGAIHHGVWGHRMAMAQAQLLLPIFYTIALYNGTYSVTMLTKPEGAIRKLAIAVALSAGLLTFVVFYAKAGADFSRAMLAIGLAVSVLLMAAARMGMIALVRHRWRGKVQNQLILDDGGPTFSLANAQKVDVRELALSPDRSDPLMLDRMGQLFRNQDKVVISCPQERREQWALLLKCAGVRGEIVSEPAHVLGALGIMRYPGQERTTLIVSSGPLGLRSRVVKRLFDLAVASAAIVLLSPVLLLAALAIKLEDGGPLLFVQRRFGRGNRFFRMYKFRSMRVDQADGHGAVSTQRGDERVTRVGRLLRRTSIDELPQLFNVLANDMSIVGPRPHALGSQAGAKLFWEVDGRYWRRHTFKPGLTGLAQVRGHRGATEEERHLTDRLQSDLEYIANWSLGRDVAILARTAAVMVHHRAY